MTRAEEERMEPTVEIAKRLAQSLPQPVSTPTEAPTSSSASPTCGCDGLGYIPSAHGYAPCVCQVERRIAKELPPRFQQARLDHFPKPIVEKVGSWLSNPREGLLLSGPVGTGKTHLAAAIVRRQILRSKKAVFRRLVEFYAAIRETYRLNASEIDVLSPYLEAPFLVLDDLGAGGLTD